MADRELSAAAERRVQHGLAVQPLVAALAGFVVFRVMYYAAPLQTALVIAVFIGIAGIVITVCLAYPAFLWLLRRGRVSSTSTIVSGVILGNVPSAIAIGATALGRLRQAGTIPDPSELVAAGARASLVGSVAGAASAAVFWWIAGRHIDVERRASGG